ncbi:N-acetyltransferase domain-containing protein [Bordetella tumbae]|uniref:hypothetical protein n=1 Tax=Bordetella tumbae TaxID=1649139 RepID=UPI0039F1076C
MNDSGTSFQNIEHIEAVAWHDMYKAAPVAYASENALNTTLIGDGACLSHGQLVVTELARVVGVSSSAYIDEAIQWMQENCPAGWSLQIPRVQENAAIRGLLEDLGYEAKGNGWAKFRHAPTTVEMPAIPHLYSRVAEQKDAAVFGQLVCTGFGFPASMGQWFSELVGRPNWSVLIAYWDDVPVGCGAIYSAAGYSWMGVDTTLPEFRGRGVQSHLIRARLQHGMALGSNEFTAETGQPDAGQEAQHRSFSNYVRAGFARAYVRLNYVKSTGA